MKTGSELDTPIRQFTTDKEFSKLFIKAVLGSKFNVETSAVIRTVSELKHFNFPNRCCIKPTHASGVIFFRKQGEEVPIEELAGWFDLNFYRITRERNYKHLKPKIIVEPLVFDSSENIDYKFFCFKGKVGFLSVDVGRHNKHLRVFYDAEWNLLPVSMRNVSSKCDLEKPRCFDEMISICNVLSGFFDLVRIDLYTNGDEILVGEITHCAGGASIFFSCLEQEALLCNFLFNQAQPFPQKRTT